MYGGSQLGLGVPCALFAGSAGAGAAFIPRVSRGLVRFSVALMGLGFGLAEGAAFDIDAVGSVWTETAAAGATAAAASRSGAARLGSAIAGVAFAVVADAISWELSACAAEFNGASCDAAKRERHTQAKPRPIVTATKKTKAAYQGFLFWAPVPVVPQATAVRG